MTKDEALKLSMEAMEITGGFDVEITAIKEALMSHSDGAQPEPWEKFCDSNCVWTDHHPDCKLAEQKPVAWKYDVTHNQDGTVSVALPDGDELRIVLPNRQEPYCWTWDEFVSGGKWRAEYGWKKPTKKVVNLQPLYTTPPPVAEPHKRKPLTDEEIDELSHSMVRGDKSVNWLCRAIERKHGIKEEA